MRFGKIQHRSSKPKPHGVRWVLDGEPYSKWFPKRPEADRYRSRLMTAQQDGEWFDRRTGEPESWHPLGADQPVYAWVRQWVAEEWPTWAPRTRQSNLHGLCRFVPLVCDPKAPTPPAGLRAYLRSTLPPGVEVDPSHDAERWLSRWCLSLGELDEELLADVDRRLGIGDAGQVLAPETANRFRKPPKRCLRRAVELKKLPANPWPPTPKGRSSRKAERKRKAVDVRRLPSPQTMAAILDAIPSHQPASRMYRVMTATSYYGGLRPSETKYVRPRVLCLPEEGWGWIAVTEVDDGEDNPADTKTGGQRRVPIPPVLVAILREWIADRGAGADELLFRTRNGNRPSESNWNRALKRGCRRAGFRPLRPYDARHACATTWLQAGVPLGEAAYRLGHSVETLVAYYVGALQGDDVTANQRIDAALPHPVVRWLCAWAG